MRTPLDRAALVTKKLRHLNVDIASLSETKCSNEDHLVEKAQISHYSGLESQKARKSKLVLDLQLEVIC